MRKLTLLGCILGGAYAGALATTSLASDELMLPPGEPKRFCGAYLDCHLGVAVMDARVLGPVPAAPGLRRVAVQVRVSSDARRARLALDRPSATIRDAEGRRWFRDLDAERELGLDPDRALGEALPPGGQRDVTLVFRLPGDVPLPRLQVEEGGRLERFAELFLIGDEDSLLHAPVTHALPLDG